MIVLCVDVGSVLDQSVNDLFAAALDGNVEQAVSQRVGARVERHHVSTDELLDHLGLVPLNRMEHLMFFSVFERLDEDLFLLAAGLLGLDLEQVSSFLIH